MASFETIVRPVIFPNIRPAPARSLPPEDDPEKGVCVIKGSSAKTVTLSYSMNVSTSISRPTETERRVDEARVYQTKDPPGTGINKKNFVDVEVANRITMDTGSAPAIDPGTGEGSGIDAGGGGSGKLIETNYYQKVQEAANIEVKRRNVIQRSGEETQSGPL